MRYCLFLLLIWLLIGCNQKEPAQKEQYGQLEEIGEIKKLILQGYTSYHAKYFSETENCLFEKFINNELDHYEPYYDEIYRGILIKYYYCPYNNFHFSIIKGREGYYYHGLMDLKYLADVLPQRDYKIVKGHGGKMKSPFDDLRLYSDTLRDIDHLEDILNKEFVIGENPSEHDQVAKLRNSMLFLRDIYVPERKTDTGFDLPRELDIDDLEAELVKIKGGNLSIEEKDFLSKFEHPISLSKKIIIYKFDNEGLIFFVHELLKSGKVIIQRYFLPQHEKWIRLESDLVRPDQYDC